LFKWALIHDCIGAHFLLRAEMVLSCGFQLIFVVAEQKK